MNQIIVRQMGARELLTIFVLTGIFVSGQGIAAGEGTAPQTSRDLFSDSWAATDALGRRLPGFEECGPVREGKFVGIFYWTWHTHSGGQGPYDNSAILAKDPANPQWGPIGASHHWGQPQLGYYISTDRYVIRKHA